MRGKLQQKAKQLLEEAESPTEQCVALDLIANVHVAPEPGSRTPPDPTPAFQAWNKIVDIVERAPLFPLQELSDRLVQWLPFLVDHREYEPLMAKLDAAIAHRTGRFAAANNCSARARSLAEQGRLVHAIRELNRAKIDWFSNETLPLALKSVLLIARTYSSLGLLFAAKYYALAVAYIALPSEDQRVKPLIARGFFLAAECDYSSGAWLQSLSLLRAGQVAQSHYVGKELEGDDADLRRILLYGAIIYGVSEKAAPAIRAKVVELTKDWPDLDVLKATATNAVKAFIEECADGREARTTFFRAPFSECGERQTVEWTALGLEWSVTWKSGRDLNLAAEQFLAVAQIVTCDLARSDLYIVPSRVRVEIVEGSKTHVDAERLHDNTKSDWRITIPPGPPTADRHVEDVAVVAQILHQQSLRADEWPVFEALGKEGLFQNTMLAAHYSTVYAAVDPVPELAQPAEPDARFAGLTWRTKTDDALAWNTKLVEEYKPGQVQELLERRYAMGLKKCQLSLKRLLADAPSRETLLGLRAEGWLDWQLFSAISGVAIAWRVPAKGLRLDQEAGLNEATRMMRSPEEQADWQEVPLTEFSREALERQLKVNMMSSLQLMGLRSRQFTPNFAGLKTFARTKLRLFDDDIAHADPLATSISG